MKGASKGGMKPATGKATAMPNCKDSSGMDKMMQNSGNGSMSKGGK